MAKRRLQKKEQYITEIISKRTGKISYKFEYRYTDIAGNPARETRTFSAKDFSSPEEAKRAAVLYRDQFLLQYEKTGIPVKRAITLDELFEKKFELFPKSLKTRKKHKSYYGLYIQPSFGNTDIKDLKAEDIQISLNAMAANKSDDLISSVLSIWRELFKTAIFMDVVVSDITIKVIKPKSKAANKKRAVLSTVPSLDYVINKIKEKSRQNDKAYYNGEILCYVIRVMAITGIRPAECFAISRDDIDLVNKELSINFSVGSDFESRKKLIPTKTTESERILPILPKLETVLKELMEFTDNHYLFMDWDNEFFEIDNVSSKIAHIFKDDSYTFNLYNLRHQFATDLTLNNTDLRTVQDLMGHTNAEMTLSYARSNKDKQIEALEKRYVN